MTEEEKKAHKHKLAKLWRKSHPEYIKAQNKYWKEMYQQTKPCECVCKFCGRKFNAARKHYKVCPQCLADWHRKAEITRKAVVVKQEERKAEYDQIIRMRKQGLKQQVIADTLGRSQSGVSAILRRLKA